MATYVTILTIVHVAISLVGIGSGFVVLFGMLTAKRLDGWTAAFLATTVFTSASGFLFPVDKFLPSHAIGILSLVVLALAIYARYSRRLSGGWRGAYVLGAVVAQYFNFFVLIVQAFLKVPALHDLAPAQTEPPFVIAQLAALVGFGVLGTICFVRFREPLSGPTQSL